MADKWTSDGVSQAKQDAIIADVTAKAHPRAIFGSSIIGMAEPTNEERASRIVSVMHEYCQVLEGRILVVGQFDFLRS